MAGRLTTVWMQFELTLIPPLACDFTPPLAREEKGFHRYPGYLKTFSSGFPIDDFCHRPSSRIPVETFWLPFPSWQRVE